jgi:hypothetical protein
LCICQACLHPFFTELKQINSTMPDGSPLPTDMFLFTQEELVMAPGILDALVPLHLKHQSSVYSLHGSHSSAPEQQQQQTNLTVPTSATPVVVPDSNLQPQANIVNQVDSVSAVADNVVGSTGVAPDASQQG